MILLKAEHVYHYTTIITTNTTTIINTNTTTIITTNTTTIITTNTTTNITTTMSRKLALIHFQTRVPSAVQVHAENSHIIR